jgi:Na+-driven multidrug efflux pump
MGRGAVVLLLPLVAVAFLVRIVAVALLRRRWPRVASAVERWWLWLPLAAVLVAVTAARPLIGLLVTVVTIVVLTRASSVGSPFRPR